MFRHICTNMHTTAFVCIYTYEGNGTALQYFCLENPMDGGAWWAAVHGVARVGHNWATSFSLFTFMHWRRKWQPTPVFLPGESQGREAWWAAVYGVAQSRTRLKRHSSSSSSTHMKKVKVLVAQLLCNPLDCVPPGSSVHGILQARILQWVAIPFSRGSSLLRDWTQVSCIAGKFFTIWSTRQATYFVGVCTHLHIYTHTKHIDSHESKSSLAFRVHVLWLDCCCYRDGIPIIVVVCVAS